MEMKEVPRIEIEIKKTGRNTKLGIEWVKTFALDTPLLREKLCSNPKCFRYVGALNRSSKVKNNYCSRECVREVGRKKK